MGWGQEAEFFSRSRIKLSLYAVKIFSRKSFERGSLDKVLPVELVGVLYETLFPRGVRMGEVDVDTCFPGYHLVRSEFGPVVGGDGPDVSPDGSDYVHASVGDAPGVLAIGERPDPGVSGKPVDHREDGVLVVPAHQEILLEIPEAGAVRLRRPELYALADTYAGGGTHRPDPALEPVPAMPVERAAVPPVLPYVLVYPLGRTPSARPFSCGSRLSAQATSPSAGISARPPPSAP